MLTMSIHRNIKVLTWFNFFTDFKLYAPIAIIYFSKVSGSFALGMSIFSIAMVSSALFEIPTGVFSDKIGRRKTVILGALSAVIFSVFYAIGTYYWVLVIGAIFEGLSRSFYSGNNDALLHDTLSEGGNKHEYSEFLGRIVSMFQLALAISAVAGSAIASISFSIVMWTSVISQVICLYFSFLLIEPKIKSEESGNVYKHLKKAILEFKKNKKLRLLSLSSVLTYGFGESLYQFQAAFYNTLWPLWAVGVAKGMSNITAFFSFRYSGRIIKKYSEIKLMFVSNIYYRAINMLATIFPTMLSPLLMSSTSMFFGISTVSRNTLFQKEFTDEQRATMASLNSFLCSIFFGIASFLIGFLADKVSPAIALFASQVFLLPSIWIYWKLYKYDKEAKLS